MLVFKAKWKHAHNTFFCLMGGVYIADELFLLFGVESRFLGGFLSQVIVAFIFALLLMPKGGVKEPSSSK